MLVFVVNLGVEERIFNSSLQCEWWYKFSVEFFINFSVFTRVFLS